MKITLEHVPEERIFKIPDSYEWVQLTYTELRIAPEGAPIGYLTKEGYWNFNHIGIPGEWTDVILG